MVIGAASLALSTASFAGGPEAPSTTPANQNGWYMGAHAGIAALLSDSISGRDNSMDAGASVGYRFGQFRVETEVSYMRDFDAKFNIYNAMVNGIYDFNLDSKFTPYIGIGVGYSHFSNNGAIFFTNSSAFAYQGLIGFTYSLNKHLDLGLGYRIMSWTSNPFNIFQNSINVSLGYNF